MKRTLTRYFVTLALVSSTLMAAALLLTDLGTIVSLLLVFGFNALLGLILASNLASQFITPLNRMTKIVTALDNSEMANLAPFKQQNEIGALGRKIVGMASRNSAVEEANKDALTGLANRRHLMQWLEDQLGGDSKQIAVMFVDLDKFKPVNDTHGHDVGDEALKKMAEFMGTCIRETDLLARIGGDEFVLAFRGLETIDALESRAKKVIELVASPFWVGDIRVKLGASVGIAIGPDDGTTAEELLNAADEAMYAVKKSGRNGFKFYS